MRVRYFIALIMNVPIGMSDVEMGNPPADLVQTVEEAQNHSQECVGPSRNTGNEKSSGTSNNGTITISVTITSTGDRHVTLRSTHKIGRASCRERV